jgi:hypothetical protein
LPTLFLSTQIEQNLLNYACKKQQVLLKQPVKDLDSGLTVQGQTELPAFGTKIYLL